MVATVLIFSSPASIPFSFAIHTWFVVKEKNRSNRYEILFRKVGSKKDNLYINHFLPSQGIEIIPFYERFFWKSKIIAKIRGKNAKKLIKTIKNSIKEYPNKNNYKFIGPNSNTYTQWILNKAKIKTKLPWNAFGKGYL